MIAHTALRALPRPVSFGWRVGPPTNDRPLQVPAEESKFQAKDVAFVQRKLKELIDQMAIGTPTRQKDGTLFTRICYGPKDDCYARLKTSENPTKSSLTLEFFWPETLTIQQSDEAPAGQNQGVIQCRNILGLYHYDLSPENTGYADIAKQLKVIKTAILQKQPA